MDVRNLDVEVAALRRDKGVYSLCLSASCTFTDIGEPSRLRPRVTTRPGGISWIIRRNCASLSTAVPFMVRMTSCSLMPALPAGASWSTMVTSTPFSSFNFRALRRSVVTSAISTPRYEVVPPSSLAKTQGCPPCSVDQFCGGLRGDEKQQQQCRTDENVFAHKHLGPNGPNYRPDRLIQISPFDVCTFTMGPPPFSEPSAVSVLFH